MGTLRDPDAFMSPALRRFFSNREGRIVVMQVPNLPAVATMLFAAATWFSDGKARDVFGFFAGAALLTWSYLEIRCGDSPFRRALGVVVLATLVAYQILR